MRGRRLSAGSVQVATDVVKPIRKVNLPKWKFRLGRWIPIHTWTEDEREFLRMEYKGTIQSLKGLAKEMGLSDSSIRGQLSRMGLIRLEGRWSEEEQKFLEENFSKLPLTTLARKLHRGINAVAAKAYRLKVSRRIKEGFFTMRDVSRLLGVDERWIERRLRNGFKIDVHPPERISEKALRDFIRRYPEELTGHNVDFVMLVDILAGVKI